MTDKTQIKMLLDEFTIRLDDLSEIMCQTLPNFSLTSELSERCKRTNEFKWVTRMMMAENVLRMAVNSETKVYFFEMGISSKIALLAEVGEKLDDLRNSPSMREKLKAIVLHE